MLRRQRYTKDTIKNLEQKVYRVDAGWETKASTALNKLAKDLVKAQDKAERRWEIIGFQKEKVSECKQEEVRQRSELAKMEFKVKQSAIEQQQVALKLVAGDPIKSSDLSDMAKQAAAKVEDSLSIAKQGVAKKLQGSWKKFLTNSKIEVSMGSSKVKSDLEMIQENVVEELTRKWSQTDCNAKAKSVFYRTLIQQEIGQTNSRGEFSEMPQCTSLDSYRAMCDIDMVKTCQTQKVEKVSSTGDYRCAKRASVEFSEMSKIVYCPRSFEDQPYLPCVSVKTCDERLEDGTMSKDCALF